jgi:hypothetical protein
MRSDTIPASAGFASPGFGEQRWISHLFGRSFGGAIGPQQDFRRVDIVRRFRMLRHLVLCAAPGCLAPAASKAVQNILHAAFQWLLPFAGCLTVSPTWQVSLYTSATSNLMRKGWCCSRWFGTKASWDESCRFLCRGLKQPGWFQMPLRR